MSFFVECRVCGQDVKIPEPLEDTHCPRCSVLIIWEKEERVGE